MLVTDTNMADIAYYNEQFKMINKGYKDKITLVFFGYKKEMDFKNILDGVKYVYFKPRFNKSFL